MRELLQAIPDVEVLLSLEPEELGARLLFVIRKWKERNRNELLQTAHLTHEAFPLDPNAPGYPSGKREQVEAVLMEAWHWLEVQGLLVPAPGRNGANGFRVLSRRALRFETREQFVRYEVGRRIPKESLNARISGPVWNAFVRGEFDTAILLATKAVEVAVREAAGLSAADFGVKLMRTAFNPDNGPLTDMQAEPSERVARMELFAGAIGSYKNPQSHRDVNLDNPEEAVEIIMLANHLLRIVDARKKV
jgi:uncharacterized protein (TIGR02391 family)